MANGESGPLDSMFAKTNIVILILFGLCCNVIALILSIICVITAKDELAKRNAIITLVVSLVSGGGFAVVRFVGGVGGAMFGQ